jgi:hypothetical protein
MRSNVATVLLAWTVGAVDCLPVGWPVCFRVVATASVCGRLVDRSGSFLSLDTLRQYAHAIATDSQRSPTGNPTLARSDSGSRPTLLADPLVGIHRWAFASSW